MHGETTAPLADRVVEALQVCYQQTHKLPTSGNYKEWRATLPSERRAAVPSMTAVVPIAFPSWPEARLAAGLEGVVSDGTARGPKPSWSEAECIAWVRRWLISDSGSSLAAFGVWLEQRRLEGEPVPSASTVRLRLRRSWNEIKELASIEGSHV